MGRRKIPQNTRTFEFRNVNNKNKFGDDCVVRAISVALNQSWEQTVRELTEVGIKYGYVLNDRKCYEKYLKDKGFIKHSQPRKSDNTKYTGSEFCRYLDSVYTDVRTKVIMSVGSHHLSVAEVCENPCIGYKIVDIWNCSEYCVGNYWVSERFSKGI